VKQLQHRIDLIKAKSKVDFGVYGILEPKTLSSVDKIMDAGALGVKTYMMSCFQNTIGHFPPEAFKGMLEEIGEKFPELLLVVHPEMATERELYMSSPLRTVPLESRLDNAHSIKSIEFGGGANKGSYIDELCRKVQSDEEDNDCPTPNLESPTQLKWKVKENKEKSEVNDLVHFELLSYSYDNGNEQNEKNETSSDSDNDDLNNMGKEKSDKPSHAQSEAKKSESRGPFLVLKEVEQDEENDSPEEKQQVRSESKLNSSPIKKSIFAKSSPVRTSLASLKTFGDEPTEEEEKEAPNRRNEETFDDLFEDERKMIQKRKDKNLLKETQAQGLRIEEIHEERSNEESQGEPNKEVQNEASSGETDSEKEKEEVKEEKEDPFKEVEAPKVQKQEPVQVQEIEKRNEEDSLSTLMERRKLDSIGGAPFGIKTTRKLPLLLNVQRNQLPKSPNVNIFSFLPAKKTDSISPLGEIKTPSTLLGSPLNDKAQSSPEKKKLDQTRKLLKMITVTDSKIPNITSPETSKPKIGLEFRETSLETEADSEKLKRMSPTFKGSLNEFGSPDFSNSKQFASTNSSLLQRRMSHKPSLEIQPSISSALSTPSRGNFSSRINSIEVTKSPESMAKKEAKFNQSYRTFLANRPQNW
jgi:chemotaxis protein histidine kinase CheA